MICEGFPSDKTEAGRGGKQAMSNISALLEVTTLCSPESESKGSQKYQCYARSDAGMWRLRPVRLGLHFMMNRIVIVIMSNLATSTQQVSSFWRFPSVLQTDFWLLRWPLNKECPAYILHIECSYLIPDCVFQFTTAMFDVLETKMIRGRSTKTVTTLKFAQINIYSCMFVEYQNFSHQKREMHL